jgi:hypothetical protein
VAKQIAELIDLAQYRQRKAHEAARPAMPMNAVSPMPFGAAFFPVAVPVAFFWMPVWIPVLMDGASHPEHGAVNA